MNPDLKKELWRKSIHFSGVFFLPLLFWNRNFFASLVGVYLLIYLFSEWMRAQGKKVPLLSALTEKCKRKDEMKGLSWPAIFISISAIVTPYLFGVPAAAVGLAQIFVADVAANFAGLMWGKKKIAFSKGKTWMGSLAFFVTASAVSCLFVPFPRAIGLGLAGAIIESLPLKDADNLAVPLGVGLLTHLLQVF